MVIAYNLNDLKNLLVQKEAKGWMKQQLITSEQHEIIKSKYRCEFYHPNFLIRILLFVATLIGALGALGLTLIMVDSNGDAPIFSSCIFLGIISLVILETIISGKKHYKSGLNEALLYFGGGMIIVGIIGLTDGDTIVMTLVCLMVFTLAALRYLDLVSAIGAVLSFAYLIFTLFYQAGGLASQLIPFVIMFMFAGLYFFVRSLKQRVACLPWYDVMLIVESLSLLIAYCGGNYFIVRELSIELMNLYLEDGQDIPFAILFYILTIVIPVLYLYVGIKGKDVVLIRVSLVVIAFSVFTFKYYFSLGHPEITLTIAGALLIVVSMLLLNYLKVIRHGFTRENHLPEKWADMNVEAIVIAQTMGGNQIQASDTPVQGSGDFGGGGSSDGF